MLSLHTHPAALSTQKFLALSSRTLSTTMTQLGTGYRVNSAMDDAAGLQIATRLEAQSRGMKVAQRNTQNAISLLQTGEGALVEVSSMLLRMKDLATEAANSTASNQDRQALQTEFDELGKEMLNLLGNTSFGGERVFFDPPTLDISTNINHYDLGGLLGTGDITFQIGADAREQMSINLRGAELGNARNAISQTSAAYRLSSNVGDELMNIAAASSSIGVLQAALDETSALRSALGASANRLEHTFNNLGNMLQNTDVARGRIMDVDYASATSEMSKQQMLMQASTSLLKQTSQMSQMVASLLQ